MCYRESLQQLQQELENREEKLCLYLLTNLNLFAFRSNLSQEKELEIIRPIGSFLREKDYIEYDAHERRPNTIYYVKEEMQEYRALDNILEINAQITNGQVEVARLNTIENEKIRLVIFKKNNYLFLYKYNTGKLFKQSWKAVFNVEDAVVEKDNNSSLFLSKDVPDLIVDLDKKIAYILNVTQAEYILEINDLLQGSLNTVRQNLAQFNLMREDTIADFIEEISSKNNYMRKLHKIQTTGSYEYFKNNIDKIPGVLRQYDLNVNFDEENQQIIFDEETDVADVLHLFADDYVKRYISDRDDVMN